MSESRYRQYREWKRGIREHAASQIQTLMRVDRGTAVCPRSFLLLSNTSRFNQADLLKNRIFQLTDEKRQIKQQLKDYDARFVWKHGRPPLKFEKEPIRDIYEAYHAVKAQLAIYSRSLK
jgi:hypothetical protein